MPIKKKKISELEEANNLKGFFTIGYRLVDGVKESVKYGLEKIQNLYEGLVKAISDAQEATTDVRQLEATIEENEEQRKVTESQRVTLEQERKTSESERIASEFDRISAEEVREQSETDRSMSELARQEAECARNNSETTREEDEATRKAAETARVASDVARNTAEQGRKDAETLRVLAEEARMSEFTTLKEASETATDKASETANHPTYIGADNYVYKWNADTRSYDKMDIFVKGDPGTPFQVKGNYETLEMLQTTIPDGSLVEGFIAIGASEPYDYYAWVNDEWINQGKIAGEGGDKMVFIPSKVFNLTNTSSSSEILDLFGGKDVFIDIVKKVKENVVAAFTLYDSSYLILPQCLGKIDETLNQYQLEFTYLFPSNASLNSNMIVKFKDNVATVKKSPVMYNYVNFVEIPEAVMSFTTDTPSKQIESVFGGVDGFMSIVNKVCLGDAIAVLSAETGSYAGSYSGGTLKINNYIGVDTLNLHIKFVANETLFSRIIKMEDGVFSCVAEQMALLFTNSLVSDPSVGGTDKPASAEAVKTVNDSMVTLGTVQKITTKKWFGDNISLYDGYIDIHAYNGGGWERGLRARGNTSGTVGQFGFTGGSDTLTNIFIGENCDNQWVKFYPNKKTEFNGTMLVNPTDGAYTEGIRIGLASQTNQWSNIHFGTDGSESGFVDGQWIVGRKPNKAFVISPSNFQSDNSIIPSKGIGIDYNTGHTHLGHNNDLCMYADSDNACAIKFSMASNDYARFLVGGSSNNGYLEIATADDGTEPIYVRQYTGVFVSLVRTATLLDGSGNTYFPGSVHAVGGFWKDSDIRLKKDVTSLRHTLEEICSIPTDRFLMNDKDQIGTIAQEVEKVCPEVVSESLVPKSEVPPHDDWEIVTENDKEYVKVKRVEYEMLGVLALEGIKLLKAEIEDLKLQLKINGYE